jgi:5-methylcytosine-specific restriction endonuclease McrA
VKRSPLPRRTPLARGDSTLARSGPLAARSAKAKAGESQWRSAKAAAFARDGGRCQAPGLVPSVSCWGGVDPHHILPRSRLGPDHVDNLVTLCRAHHDWTHAHPALSKPLGLLR